LTEFVLLRKAPNMSLKGVTVKQVKHV